MGLLGYNEEVVFVEKAGDSFKACHGGQGFNVSGVLCYVGHSDGSEGALSYVMS